MTAQQLSWDIYGNDRLSALLEKLDSNATKLGQKLDGVSSDAKKMGDALGDTERRAREAGEGLNTLGERAANIRTKLVDVGKAAGAALGIAIGAGAVAGMVSVIEAGDLNAKLTAQLRATPEEAKRFGKVAGQVYAQAYGESLADVNNAVRAVVANIDGMRNASSASLADITMKAQSLADAFEVDVGQAARAAGKLVQTGLVKDVQQAFDLIHASFAGTNLDQAGDLLDTISEYSTQFRALGIDGQKAMGLISQGLKAGARDADTVADALKEFAIRSKDMSATSAKAYEQLGFDAKKMFTTFAAGGTAADKAMRLVIDRLDNVKDPAEKSAIAVALFGTKAEDLQQALYALDPTTAVAALGKVEGAAKQTGDALGTSLSSKLTSVKRTAEVALNTLAEKSSVGLGKMKADLKETFKDSDVPDRVMTSLRELGDAILPKLESAWDKIMGTVNNNREGLEKFGRFIADFVIPLLGNSLFFAIDIVTMSLQTTIWVISKVVDAFQWLTITFLNNCRMILDSAVMAFGWVPGLGDKLRESRGKFDEWANHILDKLDALDGRTVTFNVQAKLSGGNAAAAVERAGGTYVSGRAVGGPMWAGEYYDVGHQGVERWYAATTGTMQSAASMRSAMGRAGDGDGILGVVKVVHVTPDGKVLQEELLTLKRNTGRGLGFG